MAFQSIVAKSSLCCFCFVAYRKKNKKLKENEEELVLVKKNGTRVFIIITIFIAYHTHFVVVVFLM